MPPQKSGWALPFFVGLDLDLAPAPPTPLDTGEVVRSGTEIFGEKLAFCGTVFWVDAGEVVYGLTDQGNLIVLKLSPEKCEILASAHVLEPTHAAQGRKAVLSHPAFADRRVYLKNDKEILCLSLAQG
ncbi:MAG TPA: hypothetical protein VG122_23825 [Gemmata sp.]|jgi:hypothetical protein|nr:hypothetical protein [Gemmata sp.]